jgi:haloalkane dehalogenase
LASASRASPTLPIASRTHARYLDAFIAKAGIGSAYLVQDWGTTLAFRLAERRPDFVRGLAFMEFIRPIPTWEEFARGSKDIEIFLKFRTPGEGEKPILEDNAFVERVLPSGVRRKLTEEEMAVYRAPFPRYQSRRPTWRFPNELPIVGRPADVYAAMERAHAALAVSTYRKLIFSADPGALVSPAVAEEFARRLKDCRLIKLGDGVHFLQEDHPTTIGRSVAAFIGEIKARDAKTAA